MRNNKKSMSFNNEVKEEICNLDIAKPCCAKAFIIGFFILENKSQNKCIKIYIKNHKIAKACTEYILKTVDIKVQIKKDLTLKKYCIILPKNISLKNVNLSEINEPCCKKYFLQGLFLSCGNVTDPNKAHLLEFLIKDKQLTDDLTYFIKNIQEINCKPMTTNRNNSYSIYIKKREEIADLLVFLGAKNSAMALMQLNMLKDIRNYVNRTTNFETANLSKTAKAASKQIKAIKKIKNKKGLDFLDENLREIAEIRLDNPQMSLNEINQKLNKPMSKSGLNYKLNKIIKIAETEI